MATKPKPKSSGVLDAKFLKKYPKAKLPAKTAAKNAASLGDQGGGGFYGSEKEYKQMVADQKMGNANGENRMQASKVMNKTVIKPKPKVMKNGAVSDAAKPIKKAAAPKVTAAQKRDLAALAKRAKERSKSGKWGMGTI